MASGHQTSRHQHGGLALYAWTGQLFELRIHEYQLPVASDGALQAVAVKTNALALGGHIVSSVVIGGIAGLTMRRMARYAPVTLYPDTWDEFARSYVARHWVVVRLENGDAYAGVLVRADTSVKREERDVLLAEPAIFSKEIANYQSLPYQYLFLPGHLVSSIAVVYDSKTDTRLSPVDENLWSEPNGDDKEGDKHEQEGP